MKIREEYQDIVKIKKILVHNHIPMISEDKVKNCIKNASLNQEIIWGDCYKGCKHEMEDTESLEIQIGFKSYSPFFTFMYFYRDKINVFFKGGAGKMADGMYSATCNYYKLKDKKEKQPTIYINYHHSCNMDFLSLLRHELLHIKYTGHCSGKDCIFNSCSIFEDTINFCKECQNKYNEIIKEII